MSTDDEARAEELCELMRQLLIWIGDQELPGLPGLRGFGPERLFIRAGVYRKLPPYHKLFSFWGDEAEQRHLRVLGLGATHALFLPSTSLGMHHENVLRLVGPIDQEGALRIADPLLDSFVVDPGAVASVPHITLAGLLDRADLVWDDAREAARLRFRYPWIFDYEAPRPAYERNVRDIITVPEADGREEFRQYLYDYATYANRERAADRGGDYYPKWRAKAPLDAKDRVYKPSKLTEQYLKESFNEYVLKRDTDYLLLHAPGGNHLFRLWWKPVDSRSSEFAVDPVWIQHAPEPPRRGSPALPRVITGELFHAYEGADQLPRLLGKRGKADLTGVGNNRFSYDYKAAVRWFLDLSTDHDLGNDAQWFEVFVDSMFPDAIYPVEVGLANEDASSFTLEELIDQAPDMTPLFRRALDQLEAQAGPDDHRRFLIQGWETGGTQETRRQLIGVSGSGHIVYEWSPSTGLVTQMKLSDWYNDNRATALVNEVYESTRGMIPFMMVVAWGGIAVAGGVIIGGAALGMLARGAIRDLIGQSAGKEIAKQLIRRFRAQIAALVVDGILRLFPETDSVAFELLRGFVHGFGAGAVEHWLDDVEGRAAKQGRRVLNAALSKATAGVSRVYQVYQRVSVAYRKLYSIIEGVRAVWNAAHAKTAMRLLDQVGRNAGIAVLASVFVAAYVDHEYRTGARDQAARDKWAKRQGEVFQYMLRSTGEDLAVYAERLRDDLHPSRSPSAALIRERNEELAAKLAGAVVEAPAHAPHAAEIIGELLAEIGIENWKELTELGLFELLARGFEAFSSTRPGLAAKLARPLSEALGELVGTIFLERALLPGSWRKKSTQPLVTDAVRKTLAGGTGKALWHFAGDVIHKVGARLPELARMGGPAAGPRPDADAKAVARENHELFERAERHGTPYRDLLKDLLEQEQALAATIGTLADDPALAAKLRAITELAATVPPPDIRTLLRTDVPEDPAWPRAAIVFALATWLRTALLQLCEAYRVFQDDEPFDGQFRLGTLLEIAGLQVGLDDRTANALRVTFEQPLRGAQAAGARP